MKLALDICWGWLNGTGRKATAYSWGLAHREACKTDVDLLVTAVMVFGIHASSRGGCGHHSVVVARQTVSGVGSGVDDHSLTPCLHCAQRLRLGLLPGP